MVYQYSALISSMTVRENLALPVEELGRKPRKADRCVDQGKSRNCRDERDRGEIAFGAERRDA